MKIKTLIVVVIAAAALTGCKQDLAPGAAFDCAATIAFDDGRTGGESVYKWNIGEGRNGLQRIMINDVPALTAFKNMIVLRPTGSRGKYDALNMADDAEGVFTWAGESGELHVSGGVYTFHDCKGK